MKAILSCTANDLYSFNLPMAVYSWHKIGVSCIVFVPADNYDGDDWQILRLGVSLGMCKYIDPEIKICRYIAPHNKIVTYAQCSRLYAAAIPGLDPNEMLITSDADMAVFNLDFWRHYFHHNGEVSIVGADLVPSSQVPMCYVAASVEDWSAIMHIGNRPYQQCLDDLLGQLDCENFRGNYWSKDQETAYQQLRSFSFKRGRDIKDINRAYPSTQFADRRADRDGWVVKPDIIDAHLPRPGYEPKNFDKIITLFRTMYPADEYSWMVKYFEDYLKLL